MSIADIKTAEIVAARPWHSTTLALQSASGLLTARIND